MAGALNGLSVLDLTRHVAGPFSTKLMADNGAEVIKVERPGTGDPARHVPPFAGDQPGIERGLLFQLLNTSKKSVSVNLKMPAGQSLVRRLAATADIVVENFSPRVLPSLGLDYRSLRAVNPSLIMTSISNYGRRGPRRDDPATDLTLSAHGGGMAASGERPRPPLPLPARQVEKMAGLYAYICTLAAVLARDLEGGKGTHIDISIQAAVATNLEGADARYAYLGMLAGRRRVPGLLGHPAGKYPVKDGDVFVGIGTGGMRKLAQLIGRPELAESHPMFTDSRQRTQHAAAFDQEFLNPYLRQLGKEEVLEAAQDLKMPFYSMRRIDELFADKQLLARGFFEDIGHPAWGRMRYPASLFRLGRTPSRQERAPLLGEHTHEVLARLGLGRQEVETLRQQRVV